MNDEPLSLGQSLLHDFTANIGTESATILAEIVRILSARDRLGPCVSTINAMIGVLATLFSMRLQEIDSLPYGRSSLSGVLEMLRYNALLLQAGFTDDITIRRQIEEYILLQFAGAGVDMSRMVYLVEHDGNDAPI